MGWHDRHSECSASSTVKGGFLGLLPRLAVRVKDRGDHDRTKLYAKALAVLYQCPQYANCQMERQVQHSEAANSRVTKERQRFSLHHDWAWGLDHAMYRGEGLGPIRSVGRRGRGLENAW